VKNILVIFVFGDFEASEISLVILGLVVLTGTRPRRTEVLECEWHSSLLLLRG
jgi:hypothetical protein